MSREIKFRAWDKKQNKMLYGVSIGTIKVWDENAPLISHEFSYSEDCVFEQYTGLKDKNGKEIYEGDIVRISGEVALNDDICVDPIAEIVWVDSAAGFGEKFTIKKAPMMPVGLYSYEVIGNIHEPPKDFRPEHLKRMGISISKGGEE